MSSQHILNTFFSKDTTTNTKFKQTVWQKRQFKNTLNTIFAVTLTCKSNNTP